MLDLVPHVIDEHVTIRNVHSNHQSSSNLSCLRHPLFRQMKTSNATKDASWCSHWNTLLATSLETTSTSKNSRTVEPYLGKSQWWWKEERRGEWSATSNVFDELKLEPQLSHLINRSTSITEKANNLVPSSLQRVVCRRSQRAQSPQIQRTQKPSDYDSISKERPQVNHRYSFWQDSLLINSCRRKNDLQRAG